jgi:hypothetical protein
MFMTLSSLKGHETSLIVVIIVVVIIVVILISHTINQGGSQGDVSIGLRDDKDTPYSHPHLWLGADPFRFQ